MPYQVDIDLLNEPNEESFTVKKLFVVRNDKGLHTRPSTELVKCAASFRSQIHLAFGGHEVNAKSLLGILMLAAGRGSKVTVRAEGPDAEAAVDAILALAEAKFNIQY